MKRDNIEISKKEGVLLQMSEIERALDRLTKAVEVLNLNSHKDRSTAKLETIINENEIAELRIIKNQITNAISYIENMSTSRNNSPNYGSVKLGKNRESGEG